jgi:cation-transporting ATPase 13A3/4/5
LVIRTGFITTKGGLVRDILYPKPNKFKFYRDSMLFIGIMFACALIGFLSTIKYLIETGYTKAEVIKKSLDLVTIAVPPILPSAMTIGTVYAISRLKKSKIFCI